MAVASGRLFVLGSGMAPVAARSRPLGRSAARTSGPRSLGALAPIAGQRLKEGVWLLQRAPKRLRATRVGPPRLGVFLLAEPNAVRRHLRAYQHALTTHLQEELLGGLLRRLDVNVVLDVGANRGQFAQLVRRIGYTGRVVSYEPVSSNLAPLRAAAASDPDWIVEDFALGDVESTARINVSGGPGKLSSLLPSNAFGRERFENLRDEVSTTETIQVRRLDAVFDRAVDGIDPPRVLLKLDTQGYDLPALTGAGDCLEDVVLLQSEVSCIPIYDGMPHLTEQIATYEASGFAVAGRYPVSRDPASLAVIELDLLMVRRGAG
jgi:FkbM family methyltransferase